MKSFLRNWAGTALFLSASLFAMAQTPVAFWKFDETSGSTVKEEIGNLTSTVIGNTENPFVKGARGNGVDFSKFAADGRIDVTSYAPVEFTTGSFSISAIVKIDWLTTGEQNIVAKGFRADDVDGHWYALYVSSGTTKRYTFAVDDKVTKTDVRFDIPSTYTGWVHLAAVRNTTTKLLELYVNGEKVIDKADATTESIASPNFPLTIGNYNNSAKYGGIIDEVKIFNAALTADQVKSMFAAYPVNTDGTLKTSVNNLSIGKIDIYPNPAGEFISLKNLTEATTISVYNPEGQMVISTKLNSSSDRIDVRSLSKGIYFITLRDKNSMVRKGSFIKQ